uniref:IRS-type PTB domain-containing protein n=1 Tax=Strongyloides papillosus TaxID=174720 RepID=A0A0N5CDR8_STREA
MVILYQGPILRLNGKKWEHAWIILNFEINFLHMLVFKDNHVKREVEKKFNFTTNGDDVRFGSTTFNIPNAPKIENDIRVHPYCYMAIETEKIVRKQSVKKVSWFSFYSTSEMFKFIRTCTLALNYINIPAPPPKSTEDSFALRHYKPEPFTPRNNWDRFYDNPPSFDANPFVNKSVSLDALHAMTQYEDYQNRNRIRSNSENNLKKLNYDVETDESSSITYQNMYTKPAPISGNSLTVLKRKKELNENSLAFVDPPRNSGRLDSLRDSRRLDLSRDSGRLDSSKNSERLDSSRNSERLDSSRDSRRPRSHVYEKITRKPTEIIPDQIPTRRSVNSNIYDKKVNEHSLSIHQRNRNSIEYSNSYLLEQIDTPPDVISVIYGTDESKKRYSPIGIDLNPILYKRMEKEDYHSTNSDSPKTFTRKNSTRKTPAQIYRVPVKVLKSDLTEPKNNEKRHSLENDEPILIATYKELNESEKVSIEEVEGKFYALPQHKHPELYNQKMINELEKVSIEEVEGKFYAIPLHKHPELYNQKMINELEEKITENKRLENNNSPKQEENFVTRTRKNSIHSIQIEDENGTQEIMKEESTIEIRYD